MGKKFTIRDVSPFISEPESRPHDNVAVAEPTPVVIHQPFCFENPLPELITEPRPDPFAARYPRVDLKFLTRIQSNRFVPVFAVFNPQHVNSFLAVKVINRLHLDDHPNEFSVHLNSCVSSKYVLKQYRDQFRFLARMATADSFINGPLLEPYKVGEATMTAAFNGVLPESIRRVIRQTPALNLSLDYNLEEPIFEELILIQEAQQWLRDEHDPKEKASYKMTAANPSVMVVGIYDFKAYLVASNVY